MSIDMRRFAYPLEPVRRKHRWELDALHAKLGKAQAAVERAQALMGELQHAYAKASDASCQRDGHFDPNQHRRNITYLTSLRERMRKQSETVKNLREERDMVRGDCTAKQHKLELLDGHRDRCREEYQHEEQCRQLTDADRDWSARSLWREQIEELAQHKGDSTGANP